MNAFINLALIIPCSFRLKIAKYNLLPLRIGVVVSKCFVFRSAYHKLIALKTILSSCSDFKVLYCNIKSMYKYNFASEEESNESIGTLEVLFNYLSNPIPFF